VHYYEKPTLFVIDQTAFSKIWLPFPKYTLMVFLAENMQLLQAPVNTFIA
jgi:hypothetical protein